MLVLPRTRLFSPPLPLSSFPKCCRFFVALGVSFKSKGVSWEHALLTGFNGWSRLGGGLLLALLLGQGNLDDQLATISLGVLHLLDHVLLLGLVDQLDKAKALGAARAATADNVGRGDLELGEQSLQAIVLHGKGQVGNKDGGLGGGANSAGSSRGGGGGGLTVALLTARLTGTGALGAGLLGLVVLGGLFSGALLAFVLYWYVCEKEMRGLGG